MTQRHAVDQSQEVVVRQCRALALGHGHDDAVELLALEDAPQCVAIQQQPPANEKTIRLFAYVVQSCSRLESTRSSAYRNRSGPANRGVRNTRSPEYKRAI